MTTTICLPARGFTQPLGRLAATALLSTFLASCMATGGGTTLNMAQASFADGATAATSSAGMGPAEALLSEAAAEKKQENAAEAKPAETSSTAEQLPGALAMLPNERPGAAVQAAAAETANSEAAAPARTPAVKRPGFLSAFFSQPATTANAAAAVPMPGESGGATASTAPSPNIAPKPAAADTPVAEPKSAEPKTAEPKALALAAVTQPEPAEPLVPLGGKAKPLIADEQETKPLITLTSTGNVRRSANLASLGGDGSGLPGVRQSALFEIKRKSGMDDDSDIDLHEGGEGGYQVASAAGFARLAPNGLLKQRETVDTACLKPDLVRLLRGAESRFGKKLIITSGYRSPGYNKKVNGAPRSQHMYCAAADIQMPGVSKWELARHFRAQAKRGGVGTYCHTESIHVDIGPERDWNWRCRRRA